ncbi:MAG TPA: hydantoinase/oxoprolinase family protein [Acidimicrobiia bacterium]|nr:hydantoinase/oxoprolinase family protein [Acidimicrobiia bacterium]
MTDQRPHFVGVDVGGTFTDVVLADSAGGVTIGKVPTTPDDPRRGVVEGIRDALGRAAVDPGAVSRVVHGTTLATNVVVQRTAAPIALVATEGFGDLLRLGREARVEEDRYDLFFTPADPPVDARLTFEVAERVSAKGEVLVPLTDEAIAGVARRVAAAQPAGVSVCLLHAYAHPAHEQAVAEACRAAVPAAYVVSSSEVWPEMREYERAMTTAVCALVGPVMAAYVAGLESSLHDLGIRCGVEIMESSGGVMSAQAAARRPVATVESGGAAGVTAAGIVGRSVGLADVISFDMGGTTAKTGIVRDGSPAITHDFQIGGKGSFGGTRAGTGVPVKIPVVDLAEVGAGGGSVAWVDAGALHVGPQSAGAVPGPACYRRGGTEPTVTDANLLLGYLDAGGLAGGVTLDADLAAAAVGESIANPLGIDIPGAAHAIHEIVNETMASAIRVVTVQRGIDPRGFTLVGFGGAGPMHVARLAAAFGIQSVVVPWAAGVGSAIGLVSSDLTVDLVQTRILDLEHADATTLTQLFDELEARGRKELDDAGATFVMTRSADMRFHGQAHQLTVSVPDGPLGDEDLSGLAKRFHEVYRQTYGIDADAPAQLVNARVRVVRVVDKLSPRSHQVAERDPNVALAGERAASFVEVGGFTTTPVFDWSRLEPGSRLVGPAIVEGADATIVVPPGYSAAVDRWRNVVLASGEAS